VAGNGTVDLLNDIHATPFLSRRRKTISRLSLSCTPRLLTCQVVRGNRPVPTRQNGTVSELPVLVVNGPTASGKTAVAVAVAQSLAGDGITAEVVNADSMLVYRGMDIGTAKPTDAERGGVPHHLIDIMDVTEPASVAAFQQLARTAIAACRERGVVPVVAGGSALYMRAILDEFEFPGTDPELRRRLEAELAEVGPAALHARLAALAPEAATRILPGNGRRIVRALEVIELTGSFRPVLPAESYALTGVLQFGLALERPELDARIEERVDAMWRQGFVDEVRGLIPRGLREGRTASRALGYRQILDHLAGRCSEAEAKEATLTGTRRFARKQLGWFRRDDRITWLPAGPGAAGPLAEAVRGRLDQTPRRVDA